MFYKLRNSIINHETQYYFLVDFGQFLIFLD